MNDAERMVFLSGSDGPHRVTFALRGRTLIAECDCAAWTYHDWCSHVAKCWWQWARGRILVSHLDTGRNYPGPPDWLRLDDDRGRTAYDHLTPAELDAYLTCELGSLGVREYADLTRRVPGTVGNLLERAKKALAQAVDSLDQESATRVLYRLQDRGYVHLQSESPRGDYHAVHVRPFSKRSRSGGVASAD